MKVYRCCAQQPLVIAALLLWVTTAALHAEAATWRASDQCGDWAQQCVPITITGLPDAAFVQSTFSVTGISVGSYAVTRTFYGVTGCATPTLVVSQAGRWADLGPSAAATVRCRVDLLSVKSFVIDPIQGSSAVLRWAWLISNKHSIIMFNGC